MAKTSDLRDIEVEESPQEKLLDLHRRIIELEKLEILRQRAGIQSIKMEDVYHNFFNHSRDCMLIVRDRQIMFLSRPLANLLGYSHEEMLNTPFASYVHPDELPRLAKYYIQRISGEDAPPLYNTIIKHRDGKDIAVEIRASLIPYQGRPADLVIIKKLGGRSQG
jgi:two-component system cell cycle sensor histidine kinase/response regulator CckA